MEDDEETQGIRDLDYQDLTGLTPEDSAAAMSAVHSLYRALNAGRQEADTVVGVHLQRGGAVRVSYTLSPAGEDE